MSQLETMSITEAHGNGEGITATGMEKLETVDNVSMKVDVATTNGDDMVSPLIRSKLCRAPSWCHLCVLEMKASTTLESSLAVQSPQS